MFDPVAGNVLTNYQTGVNQGFVTATYAMT